ncbi:oligosaccharide flippase family protein [Frondihabitans australicus]|uniref:O-antigen/teichoic acid export membrane protein n=1 Tax=Frondihabitans australicus TaxID=386892 RepID=A0A495IL00_9MICO|nr:oligosaccharide flippase family protein [Frondihabitans australicus]RKR76682.1 O-antigen/teichoic acid export membrane protein [Frondihabitans australicus]
MSAPTVAPVDTAHDDTEPAQHDLFGRGLLYVVVFSLQLVVGSLISPFLTHIISPAQFGALSSGIALFQVLSVAALIGLDEALVLQRADDRKSGGDDRSARGLVTVAMAVAFGVTGLALLTLPLWAGALGFDGYHVLLIAVILWTAPSASVTAMLALLVAQDRLRPFAIVSIISAVGGSIVGMVLLLTVHRDATTYAWGGVVCQFVAMGIGIAVVRPTFEGFRQWAVTTRAVRLGVPLALGSLAFFVLNAGDRIVIQRELGSVQVGRYQVAYTIGSAVVILLNFTNNAWTPHFAALKSDVSRYLLAMRSRDELYRLLVPIVIAVTLASPLALRIVAPASYEQSGLTLVVLLVALTAFPVAASGAAQRLLVVQRRGKTVGLTAGIAAVVNIVVNLILVPPMGITGAAVATLVSYTLLAVLQVQLLPDRRMWKGAPPRLVLAVAASIAIAAASMLIPETLDWNIAKAAAAVACIPWFVVRLLAARRGASEAVPGEGVVTLDDLVAEEPVAVAPDARDDLVAEETVADAPDDLDTLASLFDADPTGATTPDDSSPHTTHPKGAAMDQLTRAQQLEAEGPGPRRIVSVDLAQPLPALTRDYRYESAMVVGYRGRIAVGTVDIVLTDDPADAARALEHLQSMPLPRSASPVAVPDAELPSMSVVVSTVVGRTEDLGLLLDAFEQLDYPDVEFIIVDNRVTLPENDPLPGLMAGRSRMRFIRESRPGAAAGRNAGAEAARGEIVAFTDDDVRVDDQWLRVIGTRFAQADRIDALTGLILPAELETPAQIWFEGYYGGFAGERTFAPLLLERASDVPAVARGSKIAVTDVDGRETTRFPVYGVGAYGAGANMAFRRSSLQRVRGFNPAMGPGTPSLGGEDLATFVRLLWEGGRMAFEPTAIVHHRHRRSLKELEKQLHGYGLGFTAMITSSVLQDPRHLVSLGWQVPGAVGRLAGKAVGRLLHQGDAAETAATVAPMASEDLSGSFPKSLVSTELRGFPQGPGAYLRSRRWWRELDRKHEGAGAASAGARVERETGAAT